MFDDVYAVIFITSLSDYNQTVEKSSVVSIFTLKLKKIQNRMKDSMLLFSQICNNQWFSTTAVILFFNKIDLFSEKIKLFPITVAFNDYNGFFVFLTNYFVLGDQEYRPSLDYITEQFKKINKHSERDFYTHETCATETENFQVKLVKI